MEKRTSRRGAALAVMVLGVGLAPPALAASPGATGGGGAVVESKPHCVVAAEVIGPGGPTGAQGVDAAATPPTRCFGSFAEAVAEATGGAVRLEPTARHLERSDLRAVPRTDRVSVILGVEYDYSSFGGWSYTISGADPSGCRAGGKFRVSRLPAGRNNDISSARSYSGCRARHFSGENLTGQSVLCTCGQMGPMDNLTSSIRFSSTGSRKN